MTARNHRTLTAKVWRSVVPARHGSQSVSSPLPEVSRSVSARLVGPSGNGSGADLTLSQHVSMTGSDMPEAGLGTDRTTTSEARIGSTPLPVRGLRRTRNVVGRLLGSRLAADVPLTPNEHGQPGRRTMLDALLYAHLPRLGSGSTPRTTSGGRHSTPGAGGNLVVSGSVPVTPNGRSNSGSRIGTPTERRQGRNPVSGASPIPKLPDVRDSGMRLGDMPASATPTCGTSPSGTFAASWTVNTAVVSTATSPSRRRSTTSFPSLGKVGTPSAISSGRASRATQRRDLGYWSSTATAEAVGASLSDREGATSLRCRVASSRPTNMEERPC